MEQKNTTIIKYEPNLINKNFKLYFPPRQPCSICNKVHYNNVDKDICQLSQNFIFMNINK